MTEPALTAAEWERLKPDLERQTIADAFCTKELVEQGDRHALAALCLHEQEFGFGWEDYWHIRGAQGALLLYANKISRGGHSKLVESALEIEEALESVSDRIAALLPPREDDDS